MDPLLLRQVNVFKHDNQTTNLSKHCFKNIAIKLRKVFCKTVLSKANMDFSIHINSWYTLDHLPKQRVLSYAHLRKPRVLSPLRSLRTERGGLSNLGLRRWVVKKILNILFKSHQYSGNIKYI